jgi:hypothetical protein
MFPVFFVSIRTKLMAATTPTEEEFYNVCIRILIFWPDSWWPMKHRY